MTDELDELRAAESAAMQRRRDAGLTAGPRPLRGTMADVFREAAAIAKIEPTPAPMCRGCGVELTFDNAAPEREVPAWRRSAPVMCATCHADDERLTRSAHAHVWLPESFQWADFARPEVAQRVGSRKAIASARSAILVPRVVFTGPAGSGKSSLAAAALRARYIEDGNEYRFEPAYLLALARSRHKLGDGDPPELTRAIAAPMLLIDDLGFEKPGPTSVGDLEIVIYERHLRARPTWVTTWLTHPKARERYGDGIARRLFEGATVIDCGAP